MTKGLLVEATSVRELNARMERRSQPRLFHPLHTLPLRSARLSLMRWDTGVLWFGSVEGGLINVASVAAGHLVIGSVIRGCARADLGGEVTTLRKMDSMVAFPGDLATQVLVDADLFSLRIPANQDVLFPIDAAPFARRARAARLLPRDVSTDLIRLFVYASTEFDRADGGSDSEQVRVLGHAIVERVSGYVRGLWPGSTSVTPEMLAVCRAASRFLAENLHRPVSTAELASASSCSVRTLHRAFEMVGGTTPADHQKRMRLGLGRSLLFASPEPEPAMGEIAAACGFSSARAFSVAYAEEYGEPPRASLNHQKQQLRDLTGA
jgi:AraC-like DNA-binding protein